MDRMLSAIPLDVHGSHFSRSSHRPLVVFDRLDKGKFQFCLDIPSIAQTGAMIG